MFVKRNFELNLFSAYFFRVILRVFDNYSAFENGTGVV